ncbi:hypothetical protein GBAR_LOCUS18168, partial [Geodia barretti]
PLILPVTHRHTTSLSVVLHVYNYFISPLTKCTPNEVRSTIENRLIV